MNCTLLHCKYEYKSNRMGSEMGEEAGQRLANAPVGGDTCTTGI